MTEPTSVDRLWKNSAERLRRAGIESAGLEAQLLVGLATGLSRVQILAGSGIAPTAHELDELERLIRAREERVPLAYLRGTQEFYGLTFEVSPSVLIPRPETELLVELAVERLAGTGAVTVIDVGTGSGCIPISVAHIAPSARCLAVDMSREALDIAICNAKRNGVAGRIVFLRGDMLDPVRSHVADIVLSNPPYIPSGEIPGLQPEVRNHEPRLALDGGPDGFAFHRRLVEGAARVLRPGGTLAIEVARGQAGAAADLLLRSGFEDVKVRRDLSGIERVVSGTLTEV